VGGDSRPNCLRGKPAAASEELNQPLELRGAAESLDARRSGRALHWIACLFNSIPRSSTLVGPKARCPGRTPSRARLAAAVESLWGNGRNSSAGWKRARPSQSWAHDRPVLLLWDGTPEKLAGLCGRSSVSGIPLGRDLAESRRHRGALGFRFS